MRNGARDVKGGGGGNGESGEGHVFERGFEET